MRPVPIVAWFGESALGSGEAAFSVGPALDVPRSRAAKDEALARAGLSKPLVARASKAPPPGEDPATALLASALRGLATELDAALPAWRALRIGVAIGTSSGGMVSLTTALALTARGAPVTAELARRAPYFGPLAAVNAALGVVPVERAQILGACASSAVAIGLAARWLELGEVDLAVAGGYDAVSALVAAGFESLGATTARLPSPFRTKRDGMVLGEAAMFVALARPDGTPRAASRALGYVRGFAATADGVHVTAPDPEGRGLARAATGALADAGLDPSAVDLVSAHATATPLNDAAEASAVEAVLGERAGHVVVHPFKAVVGHTLGASSALELASALDAMRRGVLPGAAGEGELGVDVPLRLLAENASGVARTCLKLSAAFGGANAALVATTATEGGDGKPLRRVAVQLVAVGEPRYASDLAALSGRVGIAPVHLSRLDPLAAAAVAAVASVIERTGALASDRTGVIVGTATATLENDEAFDLRLRERGARGVEPRRFPPTSPNLPAGQCGIAFGLRGPSFGVGADLAAPVEALLVAHDLIAAGDADTMVVVAAEHVGPSVAALWGSAGWPEPSPGALAVVLSRADSPPTLPLDRAVLSALRETCAASLGQLDGAAPGWPALAALGRRLLKSP